jgi:hypothetical protein
MFIFIILAASVLLGGAAAVHHAQVTRDKLAEHRRQAAEADAAARAARELEAATALAKQESERAAVDMRRTRNPWHYISVQRARIEGQLGPVRELRRQRGDELGQLEAGIDTATPPVSRLHQMLTMAAPVMLVVLALISVSQLGPSFQVLTDPQASGPGALDWVYAVLLAALEVCVAFLVAHFIKPERGWKDLGPKLAVVPVMLLAGLLVYGQYTWAPLHDTVPLKRQLAQAQEQLTLDAGKPAIDITADEEAISEIQGRLPQVTVRDQVLAVAVTLGADVAAIPALTAMGYLVAASRRRRLRGRLAKSRSEIDALDQQAVAIPLQITLETQAELERLGINPELVYPPNPAPAALSPTAGPAALSPAGPAAAPAPPSVSSVPPAPRTLTPDDLFPPAPTTAPAPVPADNDRRWTDPL